MTAIVKIFTFEGLTKAPIVGGNSYSTDSVQYLKEPCLGRDLLTCNTGAAEASEFSASPERSQMAYVQVQPGKTVYYEVTPGNVADLIVADDTSREGTGNFTLQWGNAWRLSVKEKA